MPAKAKGKKAGRPRADRAAADVLTPAEAAAFLRVPEAAVRAEAAAGRMPARRIGDDWRFSRDGLAAWLRTPEPVRPPAPPVPAETPEEQEAFLEHLRGIRASWGTVGGAARVPEPVS
jgi:excisionase family DNA binding protein